MASVSHSSTSIDFQQVIKPTTLLQSDILDEAAQVKVLLASETFQHTGSFKFRAAFNAAQSVSQNCTLKNLMPQCLALMTTRPSSRATPP